MLKTLRIIILMAALCVAVVGGASAQQSFTSSDGALQFSYADGWFAEEIENRVIVSNTEAGIDVGSNGDITEPGMIVLIMTATANLAEIGNDADIAPGELIETFLSLTGMDGTLTEVEMNGYEVVQAVISTLDTALNDTEAAVAGIGSANGTVFIIMETGDNLADYADELLLIAESITAASVSAPAAESGDSAVITYNSSVTGTLSEAQTEQFYSFNGTAGDTVTITMVADDNETLDSWLWLLTSAGFAGDDLVPVADNDDAADSSVGSYNSQIADFVLPETGEYVIRATRLGGSGGYTVTLNSDSAPVGAAPAAEPVIVRQWAADASASSQYGSVSWAASQATGEPDASDSCSDNGSAWASATTKTQEFLTVRYAEAVIPTEIHIYQVYNPGSITSVELTNSVTGEAITVPDSADPVGNTPCPGVFTVSVSGVTTAFDTVTVFIDQAPVASWTEIDAVELVGIDPTTASAPAAADSETTASGGAEDAAAALGAGAKNWQMESGITVPYPADFEERSLSADYFSVQDANSTTFFIHYAQPPFPIESRGADAVDTIVSMFYSNFPFEPSDVIDLLGDGSILLGFAQTNSNAQVAFYVYELNGSVYFLQLEAITDGTNQSFYPIPEGMLAVGQAMVQTILGGTDSASNSAPGDNPLGADAIVHDFNDGTSFTFPADYIVVERFGTYVKLEDPTGSINIHYSINTSGDRTGADGLARAAGYLNMTVRIDPNLVGDPYGDGSVLTYEPVVGQYVITFTVNGKGNYITAVVKPDAANPAAMEEVVAELAATAHLMSSGQ